MLDYKPNIVYPTRKKTTVSSVLARCATTARIR